MFGAGLKMVFASILNKTVAIFMLVMTIVINGCFHDKNEVAELIEIGRGEISSYSDDQIYKVYTSQTIFEADYALTSLASHTAPELDYTTETVIGLFMGNQPSSGYKIKATSIKSNKSHLVVFIEKITPSDKCLTEKVETQPFQFIRIPKIFTDITYEEINTIQNCNNNSQKGDTNFKEIKSGSISPHTNRLLQNYDNYTLVEVALNENGLVCSAGASLTQPYQFIQLKNTEQWILFNDKTIIDECESTVIPSENQPMEFSVLREGQNSEYTKSRVLAVFSDQENFENAYYLSGSQDPPPEAPQIDFSKNQVIGLFLQEIGTYGQQHIRVKSVEKNNLLITINVELAKLKADCPADEAISQPYQFISVKNSSLPIVYSESLIEQDCL